MTKKTIIQYFFVLVLLWPLLFPGDARAEETDIMDRYNNILKLIGKKEYDQAITRLKEMIKSHPGFHRAYKKLVEGYEKINDLDSGVSFFMDLINESPRNPYIYYSLGLIFEKKNLYKMAIENIKKSIFLRPGFPNSYDLLTDVYLKETNDNSDSREIEDYFKGLIKKGPLNACAYYGLGYFYHRRQQWEKGLFMLDKAIEINPEICHHVYYTKGRILWYISKYSEGIAAWRKALETAHKMKDNELEVKLLGNIGAAYYNLKDYSNSFRYYKKALGIAKKIGDNIEEGLLLANMGLNYLKSSKYEEALLHYEKSLEIHQAIGYKKVIANTLRSIGNIYRRLYYFEKAVGYYEIALQAHQKMGNIKSEGITRQNTAIAYRMLGDYEKALEYSGKALSIFKGIKDKKSEGATLINIGNIYSILGDYDKASDYQKKALQIFRELNDKKGEAITLCNIGNAYSKSGQDEKGLKYHETSLEIDREIRDKKGEATDLGNIGVLYFNLGDFDKAIKCYQEALLIYEEIGRKNGQAYLLINMGEVYLALKQYDRSWNYYSEALSIGKRIKFPELIWRAQVGLGAICWAKGKHEDSFDYYEKATKQIESIRYRLSIEKLKSEFLKNKINVYEDIVSLLLEMSANTSTKNSKRLAFNYAERSKSRAFLDLLAESRANIKEGIAPELLNHEKVLNHEFSHTQSTLQKELSKPKERMDQEKVRELEEKLENLDEDFQQLKLEMTRKNPKYAALKYPVPITLEKLQQKILDKDTVLLEYMVGEKSSYLWKVGQNHFEALKLDIGREEIERRVKLLRHLIETSANSSAFAAQAYILYQKLMEPAMARIPKGKKLLIVPDGILNYLPFEVLCTKKIEKRDRQRFKTLPYLIKIYPVHYVQSASVWASLQQEVKHLEPKTRKGSGKLLAFGDPVFRGEKELSGNALIRSAFQGSDPVRFNRLIYSGKEVETIGKILKPSDIYLRQQAKEEKIKQMQDLSQYRYIHFATHGILNENKPQFSGLVLTQDDDPTEDGFLQMREILNLKINADLVVLSACRTGLGKLVRGEGIIGLTRAWMYAGTPSVMASLWAVNDASTARLMEQFYRNLKKGMSKPLALQKAKLRILKKTGAVRGGAGFVLIGI